MKYLLAVAFCSVAFAGQGLDFSNVRASNGTCPAQTQSGTYTFQGVTSNISNLTANDIIVTSQCGGFILDYNASPNRIRVNTLDWFTGVTGSSGLQIPVSLFPSGYIIWELLYDIPNKIIYLYAWDGQSGIVEFGASATFTGLSAFAFNGNFIGNSANSTTQYLHYFRAANTLPALPTCTIPCQWRAPATADNGPDNNGMGWIFQYKFDLSTLLTDTSGGYNLAMDDSSTPSNTCGMTATSYCNTQYQTAFPIITNSAGTWRQGVNTAITGGGSYSQADTSPAIIVYAWSKNTCPSGWNFSATSAATPTISSVTAGDCSLTLTVTDAASNIVSSPATDIGAVQVDANDVVINSFASPYSTILTGTRLRFGSSNNLVPGLDTTHLQNYNYRTGVFQTTTGGAAAADSTVSYFDHAEAGTCTFTQYLSTITCSGSSLLTSACNSSSTGIAAVAWDSIYAGMSQSSTYTIVSSGAGENDKMLVSIDGAAAVTITLTAGSRTPAQIVADINSALGASYAAVDGNGGLLIRITSMTTGGSSSVAIQSIANSVYSTLGFTVGTFNYTNAPIGNMQIIGWYPNGSGNSSPYDKGRRALNVYQCLSNTSAIVQQENGLGWRLPTATNIQYSLDSQAWIYYLSDNNNQNYYSLDLADFALAAGDGLAAHKAQAEARAQRWVRSPYFDMGQELQPNDDTPSTTGSGQPLSSRKLDLAGPMFWTLENPTSMPATWLWTNLFEAQVNLDGAKWQQVPGGVLMDQYVDQREAGFSLQRIALAALYDPNTGYRTTALGFLHSNVLPVMQATRDTTFTYPEYPVLYFTQNSWQNASGSGDGATACVTNGSATVTFSRATLNQNGGVYTNGVSGFASSIWFFPTAGTRPANNSVGDAVSYTFTRTDDTHAHLGSNYAGTTKCTGTSGTDAGWALFNSAIDVPYVGWGAQPFMEGLLAQGSAWAYKASLTDGTHTSDPVAWLVPVNDMAAWMINRGEDYVTMPRPYGVFQGVDYVNCQYPISQTLCFAGDVQEGARVIMQDGLGAVSLAYQYTGNSVYSNWLNTIYTGIWTSPSTSMPDYLSPNGAYVTTTSGADKVPKYYGDLAGISGQMAWPGVRLAFTGTGSGVFGNVTVSGNVSIP